MDSTEVAQQTDCVDREQYEQLRRQYEELQSEHRELREQHSDLRERTQTAQFPPYITADRRSVSVTYETLNGNVEGWEWDSSTLESQISAGSIIRELTYEQLAYLEWNVFGFEGNSKYQRLGDYGRYYQLLPFVIPSNFGPLSEEIYNRYQNDRERIRAAWNFTTQLNDYVREIAETPRFPLETLLMGGGDCEDSAILLASILYGMSPDWNVTLWFMDSNNPTDPENINHVVVGVTTGSGEMLVETTSKTMMTPFDRVEGFSVEVEPTGQYAQQKLGVDRTSSAFI